MQQQLEAQLRGERISAALRALTASSAAATEAQAKQLLAAGQEQVAGCVSDQLLAAEARFSRIEVGCPPAGWPAAARSGACCQVPAMVLCVMVSTRGSLLWVLARSSYQSWS